MQSEVWQKCFSRTHQTHYWFNTIDGSSVWEEPTELRALSTEQVESTNSRKRLREEETDPGTCHSTDEGILNAPDKVSISYRPKVAIIVPFRDLHIEQERQAHLNKFIPYMTSFLAASGVAFRIYVIEQSNDGRKFNRGKLLNIGFLTARKEGAEVFIFHDVDLLPSTNLLPYYTSIPQGKTPMHIASVWHRYTANPRYFGGVNAFNSTQFEAMNGFPNNFWGWGGEDDELFKRCTTVGLKAAKPTEGSLQDLEDMSIQQKMVYLKQHATWKCMNRTEVLEEHEATWTTNGLRNIQFITLDRVQLNMNAVRVRVDLQLNDHWTDLASGVDDTQLDESVESLRSRFIASKRNAAAATTATTTATATARASVAASASASASAGVSAATRDELHIAGYTNQDKDNIF